MRLEIFFSSRFHNSSLNILIIKKSLFKKISLKFSRQPDLYFKQTKSNEDDTL